MTDARPAVARWLTYVRERSPLPLLLAIAAPMGVSSYWLVRTGAPRWPTYAAIGCLMGLLVLLRLMDEVKDEAKDRIAHPNRPVPRGLVSAAEVRRAIAVISVALVVVAAMLPSMVMTLLLGVCAGYAVLMYVEFFASRFLGDHQILYALSHQGIVILMYAFAVAAADPLAVTTSPAIAWSLGGLGAAFVVEVARKLDPDANPVLHTYLQQYGPRTVAVFLLAPLALMAWAAWRLKYHVVVLPVVALAALLIPVWLASPRRYKLVAAGAGLASLAYVLAPTIAYFRGSQ